MSRWDFLDNLPEFDFNETNDEQFLNVFKTFDEDEKKQILSDLNNENQSLKRQKRALNFVSRIGQFVLENGVSLLKPTA